MDALNARSDDRVRWVPDLGHWAWGAPATLAACAALSAAVPAAANPVADENARPGSPRWSFTEVSDRAIEGYASATSVRPGGEIHFFVSASPGLRYRVEIHRLGWYRGTGGRLMACLPDCSADKRGRLQAAAPPPEPDTGKIDAGWSPTETLRVPRAWVSGYYIAELLITSGPQAGKSNWIPFIVRAQRGDRSVILVQAPVNTWQAYNAWGGKSLYGHNSSGHREATQVSFNRPLLGRESAVFRWEYQLVRFLERHGYDVSYATNVDVHRRPSELRLHRLVISVGHDEYWSKEIRDAFEAALARRVNLAFLGANVGHWQVRYSDHERTIVGYKWRGYAEDPTPDLLRKTILFRDLTPPRPECALMAVQFENGAYNPSLDPELNAMPDYPGSGEYVVPPQALPDPWLARTGLRPGSVLRDLVGYEWDVLKPGCVTPKPRASPKVLFHYEGSHDADAVRYTARSGARVFSAGTLQFTWGLDHFAHAPRAWGLYDYHRAPPADRRLQRFMRNALADLSCTLAGTRRDECPQRNRSE